MYRGLYEAKELTESEYNAQVRLLNMYTKNAIARYRQKESKEENK
jgi:hypothetical protein